MAGSVKAGLGFALLGGLFTFGAMAYDLIINGDSDSMKTLTDAGLYLLMAALFFALAGGFTRHAQWSQNVLIFMGFLTLAVIIAGTVSEYFVLWYGIVSAVISAVIVIAAFSGDVKFAIENKQSL